MPAIAWILARWSNRSGIKPNPKRAVARRPVYGGAQIHTGCMPAPHSPTGGQGIANVTRCLALVTPLRLLASTIWGTKLRPEMVLLS